MGDGKGRCECECVLEELLCLARPFRLYHHKTETKLLLCRPQQVAAHGGEHTHRWERQGARRRANRHVRSRRHHASSAGHSQSWSWSWSWSLRNHKLTPTTQQPQTQPPSAGNARPRQRTSTAAASSIKLPSFAAEPAKPRDEPSRSKKPSSSRVPQQHRCTAAPPQQLQHTSTHNP
jgi:hypothetical protein